MTNVMTAVSPRPYGCVQHKFRIKILRFVTSPQTLEVKQALLTECFF